LRDLQNRQPEAFGRLYLAVPSPADLASEDYLGEPEELVAEATGMLLAEERPIIQIIDGVIVIPMSVQQRFGRGELS
jgi:hypothetical protein